MSKNHSLYVFRRGRMFWQKSRGELLQGPSGNGSVRVIWRSPFIA